ncbi:SRPBCC domain-containing protein [Roseovarius sp. 2305UL8-3]|uniref:SRPBCC domain-containing protein n=1 Tax=Roseovarius conchicola TaxID=3121636 RepID=UPI003528193D
MPLEIELHGETALIVTRRFTAPPATVYTAHTDADLVQKWMLGPPGWFMPVCEYDARVGGKIRIQWRSEDGEELLLTGEFLSLDPPHRMVHTEIFHMPDPAPTNTITTTFKDDGEGGCLLHMVMELPDADARQAMLDMGMAEGMEQSYARLDAIL